jgi:glycosyltransferase involved in cell wall biosynthesis
MPVHNGGEHLREAVESILCQSHAELELLVIDDGSTDGTAAYLDGLEDPRVRVLHQPNRGLVATLNLGLAEASHELVARMDADDVSAPDRLERQVRFLTDHPEVAAVGCCYGMMTEDGRAVGTVHVAGCWRYLQRQLYFRNVLPHGAMMLRRSAVLAAGGYRDVGPAEDYDLWLRLATRHELGNVPDILFSYRVTTGGVSVQAGAAQRTAMKEVRQRHHATAPFRSPGPWRVAREGRRHVREYASRCDTAAQDYVFDHLGLCVLTARRRQWRSSISLALGVGLLLLRHPAGLRGLRQLAGPAQGTPR